MTGVTPVDVRDRFSATADLYACYRPSYPAALVAWLRATTSLGPGTAVADIGCGTGISARLFAGAGFDVVGIDPNQAMLAKARAEGDPGRQLRYQTGEAAATCLGPGSIELVTVGQAFHWFDLTKALAEFQRILKPGGWCAAFWNVRGSGPFADAYDQVLRRHSREYAVVLSHAETLERLRAHPRVTRAVEAAFENAQRLDRAGVFGRAYSSSYVIHGVAEREAFDRDLAAAFERHQRDGSVVLSYVTRALCFQVLP